MTRTLLLLLTLPLAAQGVKEDIKEAGKAVGHANATGRDGEHAARG